MTTELETSDALDNFRDASKSVALAISAVKQAQEALTQAVATYEKVKQELDAAADALKQHIEEAQNTFTLKI